MNAATSHPLAAAYLHDLELLLRDLDPSARAEVLSGVREHLTAARRAGRHKRTGPGSPDRARLAPEHCRGGVRRPAIDDRGCAGALQMAGRGCMCAERRRPGVPGPDLLSSSGGAEILLAAPLFLLPWAAIVALSMLSPVWTQRQKATSICLGPATLLCLALLATVLVAIFGPSPVNAVPVLALFGTSAWILVRLGRHAMR